VLRRGQGTRLHLIASSSVPEADTELLERWRAGDQQAGSALFDRHFDRLARFFANKVGEGLDDLVQQTFLGCIEARDRFRGDAQFRTFLLRIARNTLFKHYRSRRTRDDRVDFNITGVADLGPSPSLVLGSRREQQLLLQGLRRIPLDAQIVLELAYWEGATAAEIAEITEVPLGTAKTRVRRAKQQLALALEALSSAPDLLQSTLGDLEGWARSLRALALPGESSEERQS
jgi:RNA polymerase sigma-70 factor (ECF subfamily)